MITRCRKCNKPLALNETAWSCGPMFCSHECGVNWAKEMYEDWEYESDEELTDNASRYFGDIAEEISREDYGARVEYSTAYSTDYDISTVFEQVYEGDELIAMTCVGWHYGKPDKQIDEECRQYGMTATFVEE